MTTIEPHTESIGSDMTISISDDEDDDRKIQILEYNSSSGSEYSGEREKERKTSRINRTESVASSSSGLSMTTTISLTTTSMDNESNDNESKETFFIRKRSLTMSQGRVEVDPKTKSFLQTIIMNYATQKDDSLFMLYTYRKLAEPRQLWTIWLEIISLYSGSHTDPTAADIINNCCDFLFLWVDRFGKFDFTRRRYQLDMLEVATHYNLPRINEFKLAFIRVNTRKLRKINNYNKYLKKLQQLMKQQQQLRLSATGSFPPSPVSPSRAEDAVPEGSTPESSTPSNSLKRSPSMELRESSSKAAQDKALVRSSNKSMSFQGTGAQFISGVFSPYLTNLSPLAATTSPGRRHQETAPMIPKFLNILEMHSQLLANALTMHDFALFMSIHPLEFISKIGWVSKGKRSSRRVDRLIDRFNEVARWVATEILSRTEKSVQITLLEKFIDIAKKCEELNNFNTLLSLLSGLNNFAVHRLKDIWVGISEKAQKDFEYLETLMNPSYNYKSYATQLAERKPPLLPYCGLYLRDFTFMAENEIIKNGEPDIDVIRMVGNRVNQIRAWQIMPYRLDTTSAVMEYITRLYTIEDEDALYKLSLKCAPAIWENSSRLTGVHSMDVSDSEDERPSSMESTSVPKRRSMLELDYVENPEDPENAFIGGKSHIPREMVLEAERKRRPGSKSVRQIAKCSTVAVPDRFTKNFLKSERIVDKWFAGSQVNTSSGSLVIFEERFMLLRGSSLAFDFFKVAKKSFDLDNSKHSRIFSRNILYDVGHGMGTNDAKMYRQKNDDKHLNAMDLISSGPSHMSYKGWAFVKILDDTNLKEDPKDFIMYAEFSYSFEAASWPSDSKSEISMCSMSSGYLCGWCQESYDFPLVCVEVTCRAKGDPTCLLLVCHPDIVQQKMATFAENLTKEAKSHLFVPTAFSSTKYDLNQEKGKVTSVFRTLKKANKDKKGASLVAQQLSQYNSTNMHKQLMDLSKLVMPQHNACLFGGLKCNADKAHVCFTERQNDPYIFIRSKTLSVEFFNTTKELFGEDQKDVAIDFCVTFLYNVGRSLGQSDYQHLTSKLPSKPEGRILEKFLLLDYALSNSGWGKFEILPKTQISAKGKEAAILVHFQLHSSCEASSWINNWAQLKASHCNARSPVCVIAAGYCAGWASACFQTRLSAVEVSCKANGASCCTFIMTHHDVSEDCVTNYWKENGRNVEDLNSLLVLQMLKKRQEGKTVFTLKKSQT